MVGKLKPKFAFGLVILSVSQIFPSVALGIEDKISERAPLQPSSQLLTQSAAAFQKAEQELGKDWYPLYRITEKIIRANGLTEKPWRIALVPENKINAFATEVNFIAVYGGLVDQVYGDSSALACVIGHEIAHHTQRHIPGQIAATVSEAQALEQEMLKTEKNARVQSTIFGAGTSIIGGSGLGGLVSGLIRNSAAKKQRRQLEAFNAKQIERNHSNEFESDEYGLRMMVKAGFDPQGCIRMLNVLASLPGGAVDGKSHPSGESRVAKMKELIAETPLTTLKDEGFKNLQASPNPLTYGVSAGGDSLRLNSKFGDKWDF